MALFMITCRATGRKVSTGIRINGSTWNSSAEFSAYTRCLACGCYHEWSNKDVTLSEEAEIAGLMAVDSKRQHGPPKNVEVAKFRETQAMETGSFAYQG